MKKSLIIGTLFILLTLTLCTNNAFAQESDTAGLTLSMYHNVIIDNVEYGYIPDQEALKQGKVTQYLPQNVVTLTKILHDIQPPYLSKIGNKKYYGKFKTDSEILLLSQLHTQKPAY